MEQNNLIIGVDFDNTIISYDELMYNIAQNWNLISPRCSRDKKEIRQEIRNLPNGEISWQKLQAIVYGPEIMGAKLFDGVTSFFQNCKKNRIPFFIISHKTEFAAQDHAHISLHQAALSWMENQNFFEPEGIGMTYGQVFFEPTRQKKIDCIRKLGCTHFIDDLEEVLTDSTFPKDTQKILFAPLKDKSLVPNLSTLTSWQNISDVFF